MHKQRLAVLIASAVGMLAVFLPWANVPLMGSVNGTQGDGLISFFLFIIPIVIVLLKDKSVAVKDGLIFAIIIPAVLASFVAIYDAYSFYDKMASLGNDPITKALGSSITLGIGLYLVIFAGIAAAVLSLVLKKK